MVLIKISNYTKSQFNKDVFNSIPFKSGIGIASTNILKIVYFFSIIIVFEEIIPTHYTNIVQSACNNDDLCNVIQTVHFKEMEVSKTGF